MNNNKLNILYNIHINTIKLNCQPTILYQKLEKLFSGPIDEVLVGPSRSNFASLPRCLILSYYSHTKYAYCFVISKPFPRFYLTPIVMLLFRLKIP